MRKISSHVNDSRITSVSYNIRLSLVHDVTGNALRTIIILIYIESILNISGQCIFNEVNTRMHNASSAEYYISQEIDTRIATIYMKPAKLHCDSR